MAIDNSTLRRSAFLDDATGTNPTRRTFAPVSTDASAGAPADASARVSFGSQAMDPPVLTRAPTQKGKAPAVQGDALSATPAPSSAEAVGHALRDIGHNTANASVDARNLLTGAQDASINTLTRPFRDASAWVQNVSRAASGQPADVVPSPDRVTPKLARPYPDGADGAAGSAPPAVQPSVPSNGGGEGITLDGAKNMVSTLLRPAVDLFTGGRSGGGGGGPRGDGGATAINPGVNVGDRHLTVGAMVNGVPTFSDGSGTGGIPRTMDDNTIQHYGDNLSRADAGALGKVMAGDVTGGTASTEQMVNQLVRHAPAQPITGSRPSAQDFAESDRNAVALRDPRSVAGIAARNLSMEAQYGRTGAARRAAGEQLSQLTQGTQADGLLAQQTEAQRALAEQNAGNAMELENQRGANTLRNTALEIQARLLNEPKEKIQLADGTIGLMNTRTGDVSLSRQADGSPARSLVAKDDSETKRTNEIVDSIAKGTQEQLKNFVPTKDEPQPSPERITQWRMLSAQAQGLRTGRDEAGRAVVLINGKEHLL